MATNEELTAAVQDHSEKIAALEARMDSSEARQSRIEDVQERMGEAIVMLREAVAKVATKDDILKLSQQVDQRFGEQLTQAHNQMPAKLSVGLTVFMALIAFASLLLSHVK
ncbi:MAG TPA: hypothetical protein VJ840_18815 [Gemmatimonadaceae bacterium]|nr:hypothetical protein [Gemmatimonadaceae bacterium]